MAEPRLRRNKRNGIPIGNDNFSGQPERTLACRAKGGLRRRELRPSKTLIYRTAALTGQLDSKSATLWEHTTHFYHGLQYPTDPHLNRKRSNYSEGRYKLKTSNKDGASATSAGVGSPGAMDKSAPMVSLGTGAGASGYIGKGSEISWLQRALEYLSLQQGDFDHALFELERDHPQGIAA